MSQIDVGDIVSIGVGLLVLAYVVYCLINQKFWNRRVNGWGTKEEHPRVFMLNITIGAFIVFWAIIRFIFLS